MLDDPKTCALYLNDALDSCEPAEVADALRVLRKANRCKLRSLGAGGQMPLAEMFEILEQVGLRLVAVPARPVTRPSRAETSAE